MSSIIADDVVRGADGDVKILAGQLQGDFILMFLGYYDFEQTLLHYYCWYFIFQ